MGVLFNNTNDPSEVVPFDQALLNGLGNNYGLYTVDRKDIPNMSREEIEAMRGASYAAIAYNVLSKFLTPEMSNKKLTDLVNDAYDESIIPTEIQSLDEDTHIMWLTKGPTYSFKDYAARFFGRALDHVLGKKGLQRTVIVATSGDTGGAVADALKGLKNVENIVFYPKGSISEVQRRQMTTLKDNIYAFEVNGNFDVCQELAKHLLGDKQFAKKVYNDSNHLTSANSISVGRLLPQAVYPFFAYSRVTDPLDFMIASVPSGNFGDMMGTVIAREMGLPIEKIIVGVNENHEFPTFLKKGNYNIEPTKVSPSSAMNVSNPSNLARLVDFYGGHIFDERDADGKEIRKGVIDKMPDLKEMNEDLLSVSINNAQHYEAIEEAYKKHGIILDPHGAVGYMALKYFRMWGHVSKNDPAVIYETADPGKFPEDIEKAIGITPTQPKGMEWQSFLDERIYSLEQPPNIDKDGKMSLSEEQIRQAKVAIFHLPNR